jgi:hypothetical protein
MLIAGVHSSYLSYCGGKDISRSNLELAVSGIFLAFFAVRRAIICLRRSRTKCLAYFACLGYPELNVCVREKTCAAWRRQGK